MKKIITALVGVGVLSVVGGGSTAIAQDDDDYPVGDAVLLVSDDTLAPGEEFAVTLQGCTPDETVDFAVEGSSDSGTCVLTTTAGFAAGQHLGRIAEIGAANGTLTAPTTPGTYEVTGVGQESGASDSATITVGAVDGDDDFELPATGSSTTPLLQIGGVLLIAGLGILAVAKLRRRTASA